jgi:hypothetical protein
MSEVSIGTPFNEVAYGGDFSWSLDYHFDYRKINPKKKLRHLKSDVVK